jgi:hypothetical protein
MLRSTVTFHSMRKIARSLAALLSVLMVSTPLSASACDLSCWLHQTASDCHSASSAKGGKQGMMSTSSAMDMNSEAEMCSHGTQSKAGPDQSVNASTRHSMSAPMVMVRSLQVKKSEPELSASAKFDHSKTLSPCSHETCSQASVSVSPPRASQAQSAYLHCIAIDVSSRANLLTSSHRIAPGTLPPINLAVDLLSTLRI